MTGESCAYTFQNPYRTASPNYCIGYDGELIGCVDETLASGCSSNKEADLRSITVEVSNDVNCEPWTVSDKSFNALIDLCVDICERYNIKALVKERNLCWHSMYSRTRCPGDLFNRVDEIVSKVNNRLKKPNTGKGELAGVNIPRYADTLVMYVDKPSTGTNQYGVEAVIDKNGIVTHIRDGKGDTPIYCKVLSGHGTGAKWIRDNIKIGYKVWTENGYIKISPKMHHTVDNVNGQRRPDYMVVYNEPHTQAKTNPYGREVMIVNGVALSEPLYGVGHMNVPNNGYVISGHGVSSDWIKKYIHKGTKVNFNGKYITIG